jgi:hypothetical protein
MGHLSYAGALASVLVIGLTTIGLMTPGRSVQRAEVATTEPASAPERMLLSIATAKPAPALGPLSLQTTPVGSDFVTAQTRYVIDARPVSYELSSF